MFLRWSRILFLFGHDAAHHSLGACVKSNCPFDVLNLAILLDFLSSLSTHLSIYLSISTLLVRAYAIGLLDVFT